MAHYLSPEWIASLDHVASNHQGLDALVGSVQLVIQQEVSEGPDGDALWHVDIGGGKVRVLPGRATAPDVTFRQDYETAVSIGNGELSAQTAFMKGRLTVSGDVTKLMDHQETFASLDDVFAQIRADTTY